MVGQLQAVLELFQCKQVVVWILLVLSGCELIKNIDPCNLVLYNGAPSTSNQKAWLIFFNPRWLELFTSLVYLSQAVVIIIYFFDIICKIVLFG